MNCAFKKLLTVWLRRTICFALFAGLGLSLWAADPASEGPEVRLIPAKDGMSVSIGGGQAINLAELPNGAAINEVWLQRQGAAVVVGGVRKAVILSVAGFSGFNARIEAGDRIACSINLEKNLVDLTTTTNNAAQVELSFSDGGKARMGVGSSARFDLFKDGSYCLSGRGKVSSVDADGLKRELSQFLPPMAGGPLVRVSDGKKGTRMKRLNPLVEVVLGGKYGETMTIYVGQSKILLTPTTPQRAVLPNGTRVVFSQDPKTQTLAWQVEKGFCRFWISGFDCWSAFAVTDQTARQVWDAVHGAVDLTSQIPTNSPLPVQDVLVRIANKFSASVPAGATFQYVNVQNCTTYVAASDKNVEIYNPDTKQLTLLAGGLRTFRGGTATPVLNASRNAIAVNWETGKELQISGALGDFTVAPKAQKTLRGENSSQLDVANGGSGQVDLHAISSDYAVKLIPLKDWQVGLGEGNGISFRYDENSGVFLGMASSDNTGPVTFFSPEGYSPQVNPGGVITILGGTSSSVLLRMQGSVVFYEGSSPDFASGAGGFVPAGGPGGPGGAGGVGASVVPGGFGASSRDNFQISPLGPGLISPALVDPHRIIQPEVSVSGK